MSMYTSALDIRGMSRVTAASPPVHSKRGWAGKKQWQVFIIQFITTLSSLNAFASSALSSSVSSNRSKSFRSDCHKHHRQRTDHCRCTHPPPSFQLYLTPSLEMVKLCALDTFPHSGSGQARLIKALCGLSKHSSGPVTLARGNWRADHATDRRGFQRQNRCSGLPEGRQCLCLPLSSGSQEWRERFNRCSGFRVWKSFKSITEDVPLVEFMYLVFTRIIVQGELPWVTDLYCVIVFQALINPLVVWCLSSALSYIDSFKSWLISFGSISLSWFIYWFRAVVSVASQWWPVTKEVTHGFN